ncbi:glycoside hydrolase family 2 protein [Planctomycetota bacterium]
MKHGRLSIWVVGLIVLGAWGGQGDAQEVVDLSSQSWTLWLDREASWRADPLYLPPVNLEALSVNAPTCGWEALYTKTGVQVTLPATVEEFFWGENGNGFGISGNYTGVSWFVTPLDIPTAWQGRRIVLDFESVRLRAEVYLNGQLVGYDLINGTPFTVDISGAAEAGESNWLAVRITDPHGNFSGRDGETYRWGEYEVPPSHGFGGVTGRVQLKVTDQCFIQDVFVKNKPAITAVDVEVTLQNETAMPTNGSLTLQVTPVTGKGRSLAKAKEKIVSFEAQQQVLIPLKVKRGKPWSVDAPQLYLLTVAWQGDNGTSHAVTQRFGLRWFEVRDVDGDKQFYLNDKRVVCRSAISWGYWPINGIYPTPELARRQIEVAKALGQNMLHFHRGIGQRTVLDLADELGLLYYEEPGGYRPGEDSEFATEFKREKLLRMVQRDRNHPSLVIVNMMNEARRDPRENEYLDIADAHKIDETRCITFTSSSFGKEFYGGCPQEPAPVKLHMLPYDHEQHQQGWWDQHHTRGPGVYQDRFYRGPKDFYGYLDHPSEIIFYGEDGAIGTPPRLQLIKRAIEAEGNAGWDGQSYLAQFEAFDRFLTDKHFRDAFASVDDLCRSFGEVAHYYQGRVIENIRISNIVDGYVVHGWEDAKIGNHSGVVDSFRNPKTDPKTMAFYNQPLYVAVKCRNKVVAVDSDVIVDFHMVNEKGVQGEHVLTITATDDKGIFVNKTVDVTVTGGHTYGELLTQDVVIVPRHAGYTTIKGVLRKGKKNVATGQEKIYVLVYDPHELTVPVAVMDPNNEIQTLLDKAGITNYRTHEEGLPDVNCLVVGGEVPKGSAKDHSRISNSLLDWVVDGHNLVIIKNADLWADFLSTQEVVDYRGKRAIGRDGVGGNYFVRQHPLFTGLPVNTAFNWEYQSLAQTRDRQRYGLRLKGEQCVVGCYADHKHEVMSAVGIIPLGRGRIIISTLDLASAIKSDDRAAIMARQILLNYLKYASGIK